MRTAQAQESAASSTSAKLAFWLLAATPEFQSTLCTCQVFTQVQSQHEMVSKLCCSCQPGTGSPAIRACRKTPCLNQPHKIHSVHFFLISWFLIQNNHTWYTYYPYSEAFFFFLNTEKCFYLVESGFGFSCLLCSAHVLIQKKGCKCGMTSLSPLLFEQLIIPTITRTLKFISIYEILPSHS